MLTGAIGVIQLIIETLLDLDRPSPRERLARLLTWRRARSRHAGRWSANDGIPYARSAGERGTAGHAQVKRGGSDQACRHARPQQRRGRDQRLAQALRHASVLDGVDLTVRIGEIVALLGPSGSGKSTLLRCVNHLENWDAGVVRVGGRRLGFRDDGRALSPRAVAMERAGVGVGMVFQQFNLFSHLSAKENIAGPLRWVHGLSRPDADRRARELLARVGLSERAGALPRHLSGGQQQRVAIARALAPNPSVLLLDEPTSALDPELVGEVVEVIRRLAIEDGLTMIIATHQLRFAGELADRVLFLSGGAIIEDGPADEVLTHPKHPLTARFLRIMGADHALEVPA